MGVVGVVSVLFLLATTAAAVDCSLASAPCAHSCSASACVCDDNYKLSGTTWCQLTANAALEFDATVVGVNASSSLVNAALRNGIAGALQVNVTKVRSLRLQALGSTTVDGQVVIIYKVKFGIVRSSFTEANATLSVLETQYVTMRLLEYMNNQLRTTNLLATVPLVESVSLSNSNIVVATTDTLLSGSVLESGMYLNGTSSFLVMQPDGNLVMYEGHMGNFRGKIWNSGTKVTEFGAVRAKMETSGNFAIYELPVANSTSTGSLIWQTSTTSAAATLKVNSTGQLTVVSTGGVTVWSTSPTVSYTESSGSISSIVVSSSNSISSLAVNGDTVMAVVTGNISILSCSAFATLNGVAMDLVNASSTVAIFSLRIQPEMNFTTGSKLYVSVTSLRSTTGISYSGLPNLQITSIYYVPESLARGFGSTTTFSTTDSGKATDSVLTECVTLSAASSAYFRINLSANAKVYAVVLNVDAIQAAATVDLRVGNSTASNGVSNSLCGTVSIIGTTTQYTVVCSTALIGAYVYAIFTSGLSFSVCEISVAGYLGCQDDCSNHGSCNATSLACTCDTGFEGSRCERHQLKTQLNGYTAVHLNGASKFVLGD